MKKCDGSGPSNADMVTVVSEHEDKIYRKSFHKRRRLDDLDSVPFWYIKNEQAVQLINACHERVEASVYLHDL